MKKNFLRFPLLWCALALTACLISCSEEEYLSASNNGDLGNLEYEWRDVYQNGDTVYLVCNQTVNYTSNKQQHTITPKAIVKLWSEKHIVEYAVGMNPVPRYQSNSYDWIYSGTNPRKRIIRQQITLHDGQILHAEISYDLYSYMGTTREQFFPHVEISELTFNEADAVAENGYFRATVKLNVPWHATDNSDKGTKDISVSYLKKRVQEADVILNTYYRSGVNWITANTFQLYVDKTEEWQVAGDKTSRFTSPELSFNLNASENKSIDAVNFDFNFTRQFAKTTKQDVVSSSDWNISRSYGTQTLMFSNGSEYFEDKFTYPLYEASLTIDGKNIWFDLDAIFSAVNQVTHTNLTNGQNVTTATVTFASHSFNAEVTTKINKIENNPPATGKGKIVYFAVTAVFDQAEIENGGSITKKCVLVKYENGYDWGICEYEDDFPTSFTYTETFYGAFNSAAKRTVNSAFELARVAETTSAIMWYDSENGEISGIDGLTCRFYGWKNKYNDKFSSKIDGYHSQVSNGNYTLKLIAPSGATRVFNSLN